GHETIAVESCESAYDDDIQDAAACVLYLHGPCGTAARVAGGFVRGEGYSAEGDFASVMQDAADVRGRELRQVGEVVASARFHCGHVGIHDHELCAGLAKDGRVSGGVVEVGLPIEKNFCVGPAEAEGLNAGANLRRRRFQIPIDEDVAGRRDDEIGGEVAAADIVEVSGNAEGLLRSGPFRIDLAMERSNCQKDAEQSCGAEKRGFRGD